jgi:hypothetical protein
MFFADVLTSIPDARRLPLRVLTVLQAVRNRVLGVRENHLDG